MAVVETITPDVSGKYQTVNLTGFVTSGDVSLGHVLAGFNDRSVQVLGTFAGSLGITIEGSNDGGTTWATLTDHTGAALVFTAAGIKAIAELPGQIRARATAGSGGADVDVHIFMRGVR